MAFEPGATGLARLSVYDALGREVAVLAAGDYGTGPHALALDVAGWPSGVYVVRLVAGGRVATARLTLGR